MPNSSASGPLQASHLPTGPVKKIFSRMAHRRVGNARDKREPERATSSHQVDHPASVSRAHACAKRRE